MRREIRNQWLMILMAASLIFAIIAAHFRLAAAAPQVKPINPRSPFSVTLGDKEPITVTGLAGDIRTRDGAVVYDGQDIACPALISTVANAANGIHISTKTIGYLYRDAAAPETLSVVGGLHNFDARDGVQITTTLLPAAGQQAVYDSFGDYHGALFAYNYVTGQVYCMISVPAAHKGPEDDMHADNRVLYTYTPGSTMKIVAAVCALSQNPELQSFTYTCTGTHTVPNGGEITCDYVHKGPLNLSDAIGKSCNCYFSALIEQLDLDKTVPILEGLNIDIVQSKTMMPIGTKSDDPDFCLTYAKGFAEITNHASENQIWKLIGSGSEVSLVDMARMAGAICNGGTSADPYLVERIYDPNDDAVMQETERSQTELIDPEVAALLKPIWRTAVDKHYSSRLDSRITLAKTGTAELTEANTGKEYHNRLLLGAIEEYNTAFMLVVDHLPAGEQLIVDIANALVYALDDADIS